MQSKQGRAVFGVDMKIVGADGMELPWDGATSGDLLVRGPYGGARLFQERRGQSAAVR